MEPAKIQNYMALSSTESRTPSGTGVSFIEIRHLDEEYLSEQSVL
jgi:hypothetical protein